MPCSAGVRVLATGLSASAYPGDAVPDMPMCPSSAMYEGRFTGMGGSSAVTGRASQCCMAAYPLCFANASLQMSSTGQICRTSCQSRSECQYSSICVAQMQCVDVYTYTSQASRSPHPLPRPGCRISSSMLRLPLPPQAGPRGTQPASTCTTG